MGLHRPHLRASGGMQAQGAPTAHTSPFVALTFEALGRLFGRSTRFAEPYIVTAALIGIFGNPIFYLVWHDLIPQPYESLPLRLAASALFIPLALLPSWPASWRPWLPWLWHGAILFAVPYLFTYLTLMNGYSQPWVLTMIAGTFLLTFFMHWAVAAILFIAGAGSAYAAFVLGGHAASGDVALRGEVVVVVVFTLVAGGAMNMRLLKAREAEASMVRRLRTLAGQNAALMRERNELLGHFLNNTVIERLRRFEERHGLDEALTRMTRQERRYCALMQADIRSFSKMFGADNELEVAQLVAQCFSEITSIGQDLAVLKPVGDCIFLYSDVDQAREEAVFNVLSLACVFVQSVERVNETLAGGKAPPLNFGIAVHAGEVVYGNLASETLIDPTVIGANVNLTARLEELNKSPAVHERIGSNGVILSEAFVWQLRKARIAVPGLVALELDKLGITVRDFPMVTRVWGLPRQAALDFAPLARERIRSARVSRIPGLRHAERQRHRNVEYYHEMSGSGPNLVWSIFVNVSHWQPQRVQAVVQQHLPHLKFTLSEGDERWLALSSENEPGEHDETDVEAWIVSLIDHLVGADGALEPPASPRPWADSRL